MSKKLKTIRPLVALTNTLRAPPPPTERLRGSGLQERNRQYLAAHPWCACGCGRLAEQVDHKVRLAEGGIDAEPNLQGLTIECHALKTAREAAGGGLA